MQWVRLGGIVALSICGCGDADGAEETDTDLGTDTEGMTATMGASMSATSTSGSSTATSSTTGSTTQPTSTSTTTTTTEETSTTAAGCGSDGDCGDPTLPWCEPQSGDCVECYDQSHCELGCDLASFTCFTGDPIAVVVGYGTRRAMSDDGVTWSAFVEVDPNGGDDNNLLRGVGYGDGVFVAVGGGGEGLSMTSGDGVAWENENRTIGSFLSDTVWMADGFIAAGGNGLRLRSDDHGATWGNEAGYYAGHFRAISTSGELAVAVGHTYGDVQDIGLWSTTSDGVTWSGEQTGGAPFRAVAFGSGMFVAVGDEGRVSSSADGQAWTDTDLGAGEIRDVAFAGGEFVLAAESTYWTSADGTSWSEAGGDARPIAAYLEGAYLTVGWPATVSRADRLGAWNLVFDVGGSGFTQIAVGVPGGR